MAITWETPEETIEETIEETPKKKGRPSGSKNKSKAITAVKEQTKENKSVKKHHDAGLYASVLTGNQRQMNKTRFCIADNGSVLLENISVKMVSGIRGKGQEEIVFRSKYADIYVPRTKEELKELYPHLTEEQLKKRKRSALKVWEIDGYIVNEDGTSNIEELLGERIKDWTLNNKVV